MANLPDPMPENLVGPYGLSYRGLDLKAAEAGGNLTANPEEP